MNATLPNSVLKFLLASTLIFPGLAEAQTRRTNRPTSDSSRSNNAPPPSSPAVALPSPTAPAAPFRGPALSEPVAPSVALPEVDPVLFQKELTPLKTETTTKEVTPEKTETVTTTTTTPPTKPSPPAAPLPKGMIMLNFQGASLTEVLNYLSEAAGFVIVQETPVTGTVNVVSRQPITSEDAVDLVNAVLIEKGYVAIRNGRILKIVKREGAQKRDLPVHTGSDPEQIPRKDEMVTQILPLRFGEAAKLVENLRPLLADNAAISANESSNSILLTDTQSNIRRIAEIIRAIDTSVASISTLHVYELKYANAKALAEVITELFATSTAGGTGGSTRSGRSGRGGGGGGGFFPGFGGPGGPGGGDPTAGQSEARQANSRVIAVADDQSNSLIVSAPEDVIPNITEVVNKIDTNITDVTDTRIFRLLHADAIETATILNTLYGDAATQTSQSTGRNNNQRGQNGRGGGFPGQQQQQAATANKSERALQQSKVVAVGDGRTNSLIVTAGQETMTQIAETVGRLDSSDAKKQHVYVHSLQHADAESVADVLRGMLGQQTNSNSSQNGQSRLNQRSNNGAAMDTSDSSSNLSGSGGGRAR